MRKSVFFITLGCILLLASCKKDKGTFRIQFQPTWGQSILKLDSTYSTPDGKYLNISSLGLYLSHIKLVRTDNSEVEVDSAVLLLYNDHTIAFDLSAINGNYKAIKFGIGLDSAQNRRDPIVVPDNDPVYANNTLWWGLPRYHLFTQTEGYAGTSSSLGTLVFYHIGTDSMYRTANVSKTFSIADGQATSLALHADLEKLFYGPTSVNVLTNSYTHSTDDVATAKLVADAYALIFSIQ